MTAPDNLRLYDVDLQRDEAWADHDVYNLVINGQSVGIVPPRLVARIFAVAPLDEAE